MENLSLACIHVLNGVAIAEENAENDLICPECLNKINQCVELGFGNNEGELECSRDGKKCSSKHDCSLLTGFHPICGIAKKTILEKMPKKN